MQKNCLLLRACVFAIAGLLFVGGNTVFAQQHSKTAQLETSATRDVQRLERLKEEVRHQLVMLPYYSVFDWLQAEVKPDGTVILMGQVTRPSTKGDAESRV